MSETNTIDSNKWFNVNIKQLFCFHDYKVKAKKE